MNRLTQHLQTSRFRLAMGIAVTALIVHGCDRGNKPNPTNDGKLHIAVSILPQAWLAEQVGGSNITVATIVAPGQSPHSYEPTALKVAELCSAKLFFVIGTPFEKTLVDKVHGMDAPVEVVDCLAGIDLIASEINCEHEGHDHAHDHGGDSADDRDPHVWLDPVHAKTIALNMRDALCRIDPQHKAEYDANYARLAESLDGVHKDLETALAPFKGRKFYVYHPAYGYFAERYGLKQVAIETGGKEPTAQTITQLIEQARADGVKIIFVQPQFARNNAASIAQAIGGTVVPMDPLSENYIENLRRMATDLRTALGAGDGIPGVSN